MGGWMGVAGAKIIGRAAELVNYLKDNGKQVSTWFNTDILFKYFFADSLLFYKRCFM